MVSKMETNVRLAVVKNSRNRFVVRKVCISDGVPSITDLKTFAKKELAENYKKRLEK